MSKTAETTTLFPGVGTADAAITRPRLSRKTHRNKRASKMADEDMEMDNFSEGRAESASDFAGDDENEKVFWL